MNLFIKSTVSFSECRKYRYYLRREWNGNGPEITWIMLNPSTADETVDDPTVAKCQRLSRKWGFGSLCVLNLFALRSTDPKALYKDPDPVGPDNDKWIRAISEVSDRIVVAWGVHSKLQDREKVVRDILSGLELWALKITKDGHPHHPLYIREDIEPVRIWN